MAARSMDIEVARKADSVLSLSEDITKAKPAFPKGPASESESATQKTDASEAVYTINSVPSGGSRKARRAALLNDDDEPLVDTTAALKLKSKKTERLQKRLQKPKKAKPRVETPSLLGLPAELLQEILQYLPVSDIVRLRRTSRPLSAFVSENERSIARSIVNFRYSVLAKCFPPPVSFASVDESFRPALLSKERQDLLNIHKHPYQHVPTLNALEICTCMTCVLAWNNLCIVVDLASWQKSLDAREPIPMIPRGTTPEWNVQRLQRTAEIVRAAIKEPLVYAAVLEHHLRTTTSTILRRSNYIKQRPVLPEHRPYHLSFAEVAEGTDGFLERKGAPSYEFPFHRDNYYNLEAYVPNRKWSKENEKWLYYHGTQHERDLEWVRMRFGTQEARDGVQRRVEELGRRLGR